MAIHTPIDYGNYFEKKEKSIPKQENHTPEKGKSFSLVGLKEYWLSYDKNTKTKIIIFLAVVIATCGILIFYFSSSFKRVNIPPPANYILFPPGYDKKIFPKQ